MSTGAYATTNVITCGCSKQLNTLLRWISKARHVVVHTGAGISTNAGIADFRGPKGIWTAERERKKQCKRTLGWKGGKRKRKWNRSSSKEVNVSKAVRTTSCVDWAVASPTLSHMCLVGLMKQQCVAYIISQNVDGLHLRSGIPREKLSELHGNIFMESCSRCHEEYLRTFEISTIGTKPTGRFCISCPSGEPLTDVLVDWDGALPEEDIDRAENVSAHCDLNICLGTSMQMEPASLLPFRSKRWGARVVICNLQPTVKDKDADLVIHEDLDVILSWLVQAMKVPIPRYVRYDVVTVYSTLVAVGDRNELELKIFGEMQDTDPPLVQTVTACFDDGFIMEKAQTPFTFCWPITGHRLESTIRIKFLFKCVRGLLREFAECDYKVSLDEKHNSALQRFRFKTIEIDYNVAIHA